MQELRRHNSVGQIDHWGKNADRVARVYAAQAVERGIENRYLFWRTVQFIKHGAPKASLLHTSARLAD